MEQKTTVSIPAVLFDRFYWDARREMHTYLTPVQRRQSPLPSAPRSTSHLVQFRSEGFFVLVAA